MRCRRRCRLRSIEHVYVWYTGTFDKQGGLLSGEGRIKLYSEDLDVEFAL